MQAYSDETRESSPYSLPDVEVFYVSANEFASAPFDTWQGSYMADAMDAFPEHDMQAAEDCAGWYYWFCFPGCLPDSDPIGPFETEQQALDDAREN